MPLGAPWTRSSRPPASTRAPESTGTSRSPPRNRRRRRRHGRDGGRRGPPPPGRSCGPGPGERGGGGRRSGPPAGQRTEARTLLNELLARSLREYLPPHKIPIISAGLGSKAEALAWLEPVYRWKPPFPSPGRNPPVLRPPRPDGAPRARSRASPLSGGPASTHGHRGPFLPPRAPRSAPISPAAPVPPLPPAPAGRCCTPGPGRV